MNNKNKLKLSIAMTTYNGSRYIFEQLDSFAKQSIKPDEIIICDDCSKDNTLEIIEKFKVKSGLNIIIIKNPHNLGVIKNFEKAIANTTGDIIFLSDQDDYWFPSKLKDYSDAFVSHQDVDLIFSDVQIADKDLKPLSGSFFTEEQKAMPTKFVDNNLTNIMSFISMKLAASGATIAFKRRLLPIILPIPEIKQLLHDGWIGRIASSTSNCLLLPQPYSKYRQHENNVDGYKSGLLNKLKALRELTNIRQQEFDYLTTIKERLLSINFNNKHEILEIINTKQSYLYKPIDLYKQHRYLKILLTIFEYQYNGVYSKYYRGNRTFVKELLALLVNILK